MIGVRRALLRTCVGIPGAGNKVIRMAITPRLRWHKRLTQPVSQFPASSADALYAPVCEFRPPKHYQSARLSDEPFGLLTIPFRKHKLMAFNSGALIMQRTLVLTVLACMLGSAHAHPKPASSIIRREGVTHITLQKTTAIVKVRDTREASVTPAVKESTHAVPGGWGKYGTLLATLVVMCAIALRRQRLGRP